MKKSKKMPDNSFVFWDDMWNESEKPEKEECCGDWDKLGKCNCKKESNG